MCIYSCLSEINDSKDTQDTREEKLEIFCYYKALVLPVRNIVLFESRLEIVVNVYYKLQGNQ